MTVLLAQASHRTCSLPANRMEDVTITRGGWEWQLRDPAGPRAADWRAGVGPADQTRRRGGWRGAEDRRSDRCSNPKQQQHQEEDVESETGNDEGGMMDRAEMESCPGVPIQSAFDCRFLCHLSLHSFVIYTENNILCSKLPPHVFKSHPKRDLGWKNTFTSALFDNNKSIPAQKCTAGPKTSLRPPTPPKKPPTPK